jgi:zinc protease
MSRRTLIAFTIATLTPSLDAAVDGFTEIKSLQGITEYRLDANGLAVLLLPERSAPAVTFMVTYRIGSRNESYGTTGATHLLEHLMFKGTPAHNKEAGNGFDQLLERTGADTNATTWLDRTNYTTTLNPQELPVIIGLEADRMRNLRLRDEDRRPEMTVVRNEFELAENDPGFALDRDIWATAYLAHPYRHSTLGWISDVEKVPIEKLKAFYDTYYWPDNATVSVIGDFDAHTALELVKKHYAAIPKAPHPIPHVYTEEPFQTGPRRINVKRPGELGLVTIAFKSPSARDPDYPALTVLCEILAGGENSRFYHALTDEELTTDVSARAEFTLDPSLLWISAELTPETTHQTVEDGIHRVIGKLLENGVTREEVAPAIARLIARSSFERDGSQQMANALTECIAVGDWTLYHTLQPALAKVTGADVLRVAKRWLVQDRSTTGWFTPQAGAAAEEAAPPMPETVAAATHAPLLLPEIPPSPAVEVAKIAPRISRSRSGGMDLLVCPTGAEDIVSLIGGIPFHEKDPRGQVLASFLAKVISRGTAKHDAVELTELLDKVGATLEMSARNGTLNFSARCLRQDLPLLVSLLAEQLRTPSFPEEEIEKMRTQALAGAQQGRADTDLQAAIAFSRAAFPAGHPNREPSTDETLAALKSFKRQDLLEFHRKWIGPAGAILVVAGDVDPADCREEIERAFQGWSGGQPVGKPPLAAGVTGRVELKIPVPGKESVSVFVGQPSGLTFRDDDFLPLSLATSALGQGFTSRLLSTVRDTEGLTYGVSAKVSSDSTADGVWDIYATFAPHLLERGIRSILREVGKWHSDGLSAGEFAYRQDAMIGRHRVKLATTEGLASVLLYTVQQGLPVSWLDDYPSMVAALTLDQVNGAIARRLNPANLIIVKCGSVP